MKDVKKTTGRIVAVLGLVAVALVAMWLVLAPVIVRGETGIDGPPRDVTAGAADFTFAVTADMRYYSGPGIYDSSLYFRGACESIAAGDTAFMVTPGDMDPLEDVYWTITQTLGITYTWYPVTGNHELPGYGHETYAGSNVDWLRNYDYGPVNPGPSGCEETTYSFDYGHAHFAMINEYCSALGDTAIVTGDISAHIYDWLAADLAATEQPLIFVFGHEPAYPQPDADNGRLRHDGDSLDANPTHRDQFWNLLQTHGVTAYICGHTHNYSVVEIDGVWQVDAGYARGLGDTGAASTFLLVRVYNGLVVLEAYRDYTGDGSYVLAYVHTLAGQRLYLPLILRSTT